MEVDGEEEVHGEGAQTVDMDVHTQAQVYTTEQPDCEEQRLKGRM